MSGPKLRAAELLQLEESLRQQRETFNQRKSHEDRWFSLRLRMGYAAVVMLPAVAAFCGMILHDHKAYSDAIVDAAGVTLLSDVVGFLIAVWKVVLNPESITKLEPVTVFSGQNLQPGATSVEIGQQDSE